jgi:hypothetical protein
MTRLLHAALLLALALPACRPPEGVKTGDETMSGAGPALAGTTVDDKVSAKDDPVDWRRFEIEEAGPVSLDLYWDDPDVKAVIRLHGRFGEVIQELEHAAAAPKDTLSNPRLSDGTYFVQVEARKGASVYTLEIVAGDGNGSAGVPRPE